MTVQTNSARRRPPLDLIALLLLLAGLYLAARLLLPHREPAPPPRVIEAPAPIQVIPATPTIEPAAEPAPRQPRRAPAHVPAPQPEAAAPDPFAGLEALSAAELDAISQAH